MRAAGDQSPPSLVLEKEEDTGLTVIDNVHPAKPVRMDCLAQVSRTWCPSC